MIQHIKTSAHIRVNIYIYTTIHISVQKMRTYTFYEATEDDDYHNESIRMERF